MLRNPAQRWWENNVFKGLRGNGSVVLPSAKGLLRIQLRAIIS
jgi:hypothetical protein